MEGLINKIFLLLSKEEYPDPQAGGRGEVVCRSRKGQGARGMKKNYV